MKLFLAAIFALVSVNVFAEPSPSSMAAPANSKPLSWPELSKMPAPSAGERIAYGDGPQQFGELRLPKGEGPFPIVILIHGGCWQNEFDYHYITHLAAWFAENGIASWTIEYRRLGDEGGGWPGTFLDVARAADFVRQIAKTHPIDPIRILAAGHSAGGQLALWLATRDRLSAKSAIFVSDPVEIRAVLGLAAITDLARYRIGPADSCHASVEPLLGGAPEKFPQHYAETSPRERLPIGVPQIFIQGEADPIVDPDSVKAYVDAARAAGDHAIMLPLPKLGHFDAALSYPPTADAFNEALRLLRESIR